MTIGPVSYTVIAFPGNQFNGDIAPEIANLVASDTVRILDLVFVAKDEQGDTIRPRPRGRQPPRGELRVGDPVGGPLGRPARRGHSRLGRGAHRQRPYPERSH
jgi:hypothetical protein